MKITIEIDDGELLNFLVKEKFVPTIDLVQKFAMPPKGVLPEPPTDLLPDLLFPTRRDADKVLSSLKQLINQHAFASVADLYELSGLKERHIHQHWGWRNLDGAIVVSRIDAAWSIQFPPVVRSVA